MGIYDNKKRPRPTYISSLQRPQQSQAGPYGGLIQMASRVGNSAMEAYLRQDSAPNSNALAPESGQRELPLSLREKFEARSGISLDDVRVHYNSDKPEKLGALVYAQGSGGYTGPGQENYLEHGLGHVVQPAGESNEQPLNDDARLEQEADSGVFYLGAGEPPQLLQRDTETNGNQVVQRILRIGGVNYNTLKELAEKEEAFTTYCKLHKNVADIAVKLKDETHIYEVKGAELIELVGEVSILKTEKERKNEEIKKFSCEISLPKREEHYPPESTLYAPIDHAIIVVNDGPYKFIGTDGLIGCVEIMLEYHSESGSNGYLVAHINSEIDKNIEEINRQLCVMIEALSIVMKEKIDWSAFSQEHPKNKLTLVRSAGLMEQKLLENMRDILAKAGAYMYLVNSNSASMQVTADGAKYFDNMTGANIKLDYRNTKGYPFPPESESF